MGALDAGPARLFIFQSQPWAKKFAHLCPKPKQFSLWSGNDLHGIVFLGLCTVKIGTCRTTRKLSLSVVRVIHVLFWYSVSLCFAVLLFSSILVASHLGCVSVQGRILQSAHLKGRYIIMLCQGLSQFSRSWRTLLLRSSNVHYFCSILKGAPRVHLWHFSIREQHKPKNSDKM